MPGVAVWGSRRGRGRGLQRAPSPAGAYLGGRLQERTRRASSFRKLISVFVYYSFHLARKLACSSFSPSKKRKKKSGRKNLPRLSSPVARAPALFDALRPFVRRRMQLSVTFISIGTRESVQRSRNTIAYHTWPTKNASPQKASPPLAGEPSHVSGCVLTKKKHKRKYKRGRKE